MFAMYPEVIRLDKWMMSVLELGKSKCNDDIPQMTKAISSFQR